MIELSVKHIRNSKYVVVLKKQLCGIVIYTFIL